MPPPTERAAAATMSLVWLLCLGGLGIWFPLYALYLKENAGLSGGQVGMVLAMTPLVGMLAQPFWGQVADYSGSRKGVLTAVALGASLGYAALYFARGFTSLLLGTAALACFASALIPNCVAVTLALTRDARAFGRVRVWGTIGFLAVIVAFPRALDWLQDRFGLEAGAGVSEPGLEIMFPVTGAIVLCGALVSLRLPRTGSLGVRGGWDDTRQLLRNGAFLRVLVIALGAWLCLQGPMSLFPVFVREHGGSIDDVSNMWVLMLATEIPLVWASGANLDRFGNRGLLVIGLLAGGVRWLLCGVVDDLLAITALQLLHGVTVAGIIIGAPLFVDAVVPERMRSSGQGLLAMLGVSLGAILSQLGAGQLLQHFGADAPYLAGGVGALLLALLVPVFLPKPGTTTGPPA